MKKRCKHIGCKDGFTMSVQASETHYSEPTDNRGPYTKVEVGYPSEFEELLWPYVDGDPEYANPTMVVYSYVPVAVVLAVIEKHGGRVVGELPEIE
jgi:hypothetical protein